MGIEIAVAGWHGPLCYSLRRALAQAPKQAHLFRNLLAHAAEYGAELAHDAREQVVGKDLRPDRYPLASFLLGLPHRLEPIERTLTWMTLEAHLAGARESLVIALAQILRGLSSNRSSKLAHTIVECNGPAQLLAKMHRLGNENPDLGLTGHKNFDALWRDELHAFCMSLILQAQSGLDHTDDHEGPLNQPSALTETPMDGAQEDTDEGIHFPSLPVGPDEPIRERRMRQALDWSVHMSRCSSPDLLRPADNVLPPEVREYRWLRAVRDAERALSKGDLLEAEYGVLTVLSIETGLSAREALLTGFGTNASAQGPVIDLEARSLRRFEALPPNSFLPKEGDDRWLTTGGDAIFPISSQCVDLINGLRNARSRNSPNRATSLLLSTRLSPDGTLTPVHGGKLRAATKSDNRLVLAIAIADVVGIDAAQRAFGDTFGLSAAPTFYGAYPALDLARVIARTNGFADHDLHTAPWVGVAGHVLGSRVRPKEPPYRKVWERLGGESGRGKGRPSDRQLLEQWRLRRDRLLIHLLLATGHRPSNSIGEMILHDFIPRHAMVVVADKQADPLHQTRILCTGWRFIGELEGFIAELTRISRKSADAEARKLASAILAGAAPIFAIPDEGGMSIPRIRELLAGLDPLWGERPNLHRHGLCQHLLRKGVDPEYRYFQMGWLCHDHHAASETAPYTPAELGNVLADVVDEWLEECGWLGGIQPKDPANLIPAQPLVDWKSRQAAHINSGVSSLMTLRAALRESERELQSSIWDRICKEAKNVLTQFEPAGSMDRPVFRVAGDLKEAATATIDQMQVDALLAPFTKASCSPAERYVAARMLHKALLATAKSTGVRVYLPPVPVLSRNRVPGPFLRGLGLAVAQMDILQASLVVHLSSLDESVSSRYTMDLAAIAATSILLHTTCSSIESAIAILNAVDKRCHAQTQPWQIRIPNGTGHVVLRGDPAILATKLLLRPDRSVVLQKLSRNGASGIGTFLSSIAPMLCPKDCQAADFVQYLEGTAGIAKLIRSNGPERLVLKGATPALVEASRATSVADEITTGDGGSSEEQIVAAPMEPPHFKKNPAHRPMRDIREVMRAFNPDFQGEILGRLAEPAARRRPQLRRLLEYALSRVGATPTASRLILEYAWHLLTEGGPRSSGGLAISTISKTYHRLEPILRGIGQDKSIEDITAEEMTAVCRLACDSSRRKSSKEVLGELRRFLDHVRLRYQMAEPAWDMLYRTYGQPVAGGDPALVGDTEAARVLQQLHVNVVDLDGTDSDPAERRFREVCLAGALIAEAGATRPGSIHGLTLADIILGPEVDYILLRSRGRFASVKTSTSLGYIPLEGELWQKYRSWFAQWHCRVCSTIPVEDLDAIPLFQIPGEPIGVRYEMAKVFQTLGTLVRWTTQQAKGRSYWFRKRRVRKRHYRVITTTGSKARDMARAMRLNGHALMVTPIVSYLGEPDAYSSDSLMGHAVATKDGSAALTGLFNDRVVRVARNSGLGTATHVARVLGLGLPAHREDQLPPPPPFPRYQADLTWSSVERILRDVAGGANEDWIAIRHGVEISQVASIVAAQRALAARMKIELGASAPYLAPPRRIAAIDGWYSRFEASDVRLALIARDWVDVASTSSIRVGCELNDAQAIAALKIVIGEVGVKYEAVVGRHGTTTFRFLDGDVTTANKIAYGTWPTLRWLLATVWVAEYRVGNR